MAEEKRKFMRFNVLVDAVVKTGDELKKLTVNNFSKEGLGLLSDDKIDKGENVDIELIIPGDNIPVLVSGEIAWSAASSEAAYKHKAGVRLKEINNADRSKLLEYIYKEWMMSAKDGN